MTTAKRAWQCPVTGHQAPRPARGGGVIEPTTTLADGTVACSTYRCVHTASGRRAAHTEHLLTRNWPADCFAQGGATGLVFTREQQPDGTYGYTTAFFEAFPRDPKTFIRGEGATIAEAEDDAWAKFERILNCPTDGKHTFKAGRYTNGGGICSQCHLFSSDAFTGEDLGQFCVMCGTGTTHSNHTLEDGTQVWLCVTHYDLLPKFPVFARFVPGFNDESSLQALAGFLPDEALESPEAFNALDHDVRAAAIAAAEVAAVTALVAGRTAGQDG